MINYTSVNTAAGVIYIAEKDGKIIYISIGNDPETNMLRWLKKYFFSEKNGENRTELLENVCSQILKFMTGESEILDFPVEQTGTDFQKSVWSEIACIPYGKVKTYGELAKLTGKPAASRAVGAACGANPLPLIIPCHRVVGANGALTGFGGGLEMKEFLLKLEKAI
ncbi:MAG: methylated-DNA--[protein]-cysteine S-methyltransferase [Firmicutes bacterium]|nr:methylated-DNA--[protein]-cysteine S-methyltransferase [Bacillota bacterium]